ncbi:acyl dehydratase [Haladaptatus sp. W1]|uniref:MaoC family dehydratase n=1 Tax=Haladaptatus sp. W1 TaxID=1897478 RepID=UPI0008499566|nr:MaoC family dehydratase [Haladaptatus sp. W1]ODR79988.1 acyl dehydratase [Haladaptatus sp. W1]
MSKPDFEDLVVGDRESFGSYTVTEEEILSFAEQYDPQEFHVDLDAAAESMFGELVASGWHSTAISMRILVDNFFENSGSLGSPGVESVTWPAPVKPGETLSLTLEVTDKRPLESDPNRGLVTFYLEMQNEADETKLTMEPKVFFARRGGDEENTS